MWDSSNRGSCGFEGSPNHNVWDVGPSQLLLFLHVLHICNVYSILVIVGHYARKAFDVFRRVSMAVLITQCMLHSTRLALDFLPAPS